MKIALFTAAMLLLSGCISGDNNGDDTTKDSTDAADAIAQVNTTWDGEFALGGLDAPQEFIFEVPAGATEVEGLLTWTIPGAVLDFQLYDPTGAENGDGWGESDSHRYVTSTYDVIPGNWTAVVSISQGADAHFSFSMAARTAEPYGPISGTYTVQPNDFAEVNLNMVPGNYFNYTWESSADVYYNVHFHNDGTTERPIEHTGTELEGNFTGPAQEVYSMLWRNEGVLPVTVTYTLDGDYRLHSMTRDAP